MKIVNMFVFVVLINFALLHAGKEEMSHKIFAMETGEKITLSYDLYKEMQESENKDDNKKLQSDLVKDIFNSIDLVKQEEIQKIQKCLSSIRDKDFTQYLSGLLENNEKQSNVSLKKMFLAVLFESQLQVPAIKEKDSIPQTQDLVKTGLDVIAQDKEGQDLIPADLLNTVVISTSFKQVVDQEEGIKKEQKQLEEQAKLLNQEKENISNMLEDLNMLMDYYKDDMPLTLKLHFKNAEVVLEGQLKEIEDDSNFLLGKCDILESQKQGVRQNRVQWGSLLQEKIDEKNQKQQVAETKMQTLQRAMDKLKNEQQELTDKNESLKPSKRLLVETNLKQALEQDTFNPQNYETSSS